MINKATKYFRVVPQNMILLLVKLEDYVNAADLQVQRIERVKKSMSKDRTPNYNFILQRVHLNKLFSDAHFYFICIGQINKLLNQIDSELKNPNIKQLKVKFTQQFNKEIRDHLEHIDERAVGKMKGEPHADINKWKSNFLNFSGDKLSFGRVKYEVSKKSVRELKKIYEEFIVIIHNDYALKDPKFIQEQKRDKQLKKMDSFAKKIINSPRAYKK